ncbi:hypothetical protein [Hymenobacter aerophilus]|uniref:hypothetical protein n=1 Tax=Hymenobacter aerophilus TaxID=119644 RepID=UPI00196A1B5C|nr:hypothetical protein [Hymenobacter aerophilus]
MGTIVVLFQVFTSYRTMMGFIPLFDMDEERTITAYFSSINLLFSAALLGLIFSIKQDLNDVYRWQWAGLCLGFIYLSMDEIISLHELATGLIKDHLHVALAAPHYMTAILGLTALFFLLIFYGRFLLNLSAPHKARFILAGTIFVTGAFIIESLGGYIVLHHNQWINGLAYHIAVIVEESLELIGVLLFVRALLMYIRDLGHVSTMTEIIPRANA